MSGLSLSLFGLFMIMTPIITAFIDGCRDDADFIRWLFSQLLQRIVLIQTFIRAGIGTMGTGLALHLMPGQP